MRFRALRASLRSYRRRPLAGVVAVASIALGVGATTAMFSLIHGALFRPLPFPDAQRLVRLTSVQIRDDAGPEVSYPEFRDWQERSGALDALAALGLRRAEALPGAPALRHQPDRSADVRSGLSAADPGGASGLLCAGAPCDASRPAGYPAGRLATLFD